MRAGGRSRVMHIAGLHGGEMLEILLVEDNPGDVVLTREALGNSRVLNNVTIARDGAEALAVLRRQGAYASAPRPDLILLDWNLPRMNGREFLQAMRADATLDRLPVVVLTTSEADRDVADAYALGASAFVTKPVDLGEFFRAMQSIQEFWFGIVRFPPREGR